MNRTHSDKNNTHSFQGEPFARLLVNSSNVFPLLHVLFVFNILFFFYCHALFTSFLKVYFCSVLDENDIRNV